MPIQLTPNAKDIEIAFTIPKEISPYVKEWYLETKTADDTPSTFAYKILAKMALHHRAAKLNNEAMQTEMQSREAIEAENSQLQDTLRIN